MNRDLIFLGRLDRFADLGLLALRVLTGAFLIYGVVDNVVSVERMGEFAEFLEANAFPAPAAMARLSVYMQLICGITFVLGIMTRWTGIVIALHFLVAVVMVHWSQDFRGWWPAIVLVGIGVQFALTGAGAVSLDGLLNRQSKDTAR